MWVIYLTRDLRTNYIKNSYNSKIRRQITKLKNGQRIWVYFSKDDIQIANEHVKRFEDSISHQKSTNQNHNEIPLHTHQDGCNKSVNKASAGRGAEKRRRPLSPRGCRTVQSFWKTVWNFLKKLNTEWPYDPANLLLSPYSKEVKTYVHKCL